MDIIFTDLWEFCSNFWFFSLWPISELQYFFKKVKKGYLYMQKQTKKNIHFLHSPALTTLRTTRNGMHFSCGQDNIAASRGWSIPGNYFPRFQRYFINARQFKCDKIDIASKIKMTIGPRLIYRDGRGLAQVCRAISNLRLVKSWWLALPKCQRHLLAKLCWTRDISLAPKFITILLHWEFIPFIN
jgi:hypothetical protein